MEPIEIDATGQRYAHTEKFVYLGRFITEIPDNSAEINWRVRLAWLCSRSTARRSATGREWDRGSRYGCSRPR